MRNPIICEAIAKGLAMTIHYDQKHRTIEAYCYGASKDGNELLRALQLSPLRIGEEPWKLFRLDKASMLSITQTKVGPVDRDYNRDDPVMARIFCER